MRSWQPHQRLQEHRVGPWSPRQHCKGLERRGLHPGAALGATPGARGDPSFPSPAPDWWRAQEACRDRSSEPHLQRPRAQPGWHSQAPDRRVSRVRRPAPGAGGERPSGSLPAGLAHLSLTCTFPPCRHHSLPVHRAGPRAGAQVNVAQPQAEPAPARLPAVRPKWQPRGRWTLGSCTAPHTKFNRQPAPGPPPDLRTAALQPLCQEKGGPSGHWADPVSAQQGTGGEASSSHPCPPAPAGVQSYRHGHELAVPSALPLETP